MQKVINKYFVPNNLHAIVHTAPVVNLGTTLIASKVTKGFPGGPVYEPPVWARY